MWDQSLVQQLQHFNARILSEISVSLPDYKGTFLRKISGAKKLLKPLSILRKREHGDPSFILHCILQDFYHKQRKGPVCLFSYNNEYFECWKGRSDQEGIQLIRYETEIFLMLQIAFITSMLVYWKESRIILMVEFLIKNLEGWYWNHYVTEDNYMVINFLCLMIGAVITIMEARFKTAVCGRKEKLVNTLLE